MSNKWRGLTKPISAADAEREPLSDRLFGPSYDARMRRYAAQRPENGINRVTYSPWKKPRIERVK
jgi:hypothetical protein